MKLISRRLSSVASNLSGLVLALCTGLLAISAGCGDDDAAPPVDAGPVGARSQDGSTGLDGSKQDSSTQQDGSTQQDSSTQRDGSAQPDALIQQDSSAQPDALIQQDSSTPLDAVSQQDSSTRKDAASDGGSPDASVDGAVQADDAGQQADGSPHDAQSADVGPDATQAVTRLQQLQMCAEFDQLWGTANDPRCAVPSSGTCTLARADAWDLDIVLGFLGEPFLNDCRIANMATELDDQAQNDYTNMLLEWSLAFFGCPAEESVGPVRYGLIPSYYEHSSLALTTADLRLLSEYYVAAVETVLAEKGSPLTTAQKQTISAALAALESGVQSAIDDEGHAFDSCSNDAGSEGIPDGGTH